MTASPRHTSEDAVVTRRDDPEVVVASLAGSYTATVIDLREWRCARELKVQLADGIEALTSVNGTWSSAATALGNCRYLQDFANWCGEHDVQVLKQLTPNDWNEYLLHVAGTGWNNNTQRRHLGPVRLVLRAHPNRLRPDFLNHIGKRMPQRDGIGAQPLPMDVYDGILKAATAAVNGEYERIQPNLALLRRRGDRTLSVEQRARAEALHEVATTGTSRSPATRAALGITVNRKAFGVSQSRPLLFVSREGAIAVAVLIACLEGANFATINERKVPSGSPALGVAEDIRTVEDEKRRRHSEPYEAHAIPRNARRATAKIIEMTQPARDYLAAQQLPGYDRLIVYWSGERGGPAPSVGLGLRSANDAKRLSWWPYPDVTLSYNRIRKTVRVLVDRAPQGHSRTTWATMYVQASDDERERLMAGAVESGLWAVITNAEAHLKMRFKRSKSDPSGDTPIGACIDWEHHPLTREPCGDDFLLCLQCTNAFATPRHLPRLIELRHQLEAIASTDGPDWTEFRAMAYACLVALVDDRTLISASEYTDAEAAITDEDRAEIGLLLNGKYS
ncbi:hypothetical protein [Mycolicibacterium fortuitum]|uniref:hypothetical protein n=1 Tax=Mycolicibacterium fortuitum TaxID=1766 RepID=UPI000A47E5DC|nr:hypothetical protein [Mycolicibacterium fortuitum]